MIDLSKIGLTSILDDVTASWDISFIGRTVVLKYMFGELKEL